jgi:2-polyprenyl-6-methoxyphenol hydroxylase-like FAD-dependent oxidoreductase
MVHLAPHPGIACRRLGHSQERVIIVGAGMAGLNLALALGSTGKYQIILLERDAQPENVPPGDAFFSWRRRGVSHFRQAHFFLPRLLNLYRRHQPALLEEIFRAGGRELVVRDTLPAQLRARYVPVAADENCSILLCRRATLEAVIRGYVARLSGIDVFSSTVVCGVIADRSSESPRVVGVRIKRGCETAKIFGDVIIDATGRTTRFPEWLRGLGIEGKDELDDEINRVYYTRFYRVERGSEDSSDFRQPLFIDCEYLRCNLDPADNGFFSVTFAFDMQDLPLRNELREPPQFHRACETVPEVARWVRRADAMTDVFATGGLRNCWRTYVAAEKALVCGFFAIGDALAHTNPGSGAGSSWATEHAYVLAEALERTAEPAARACLFDQWVRKEAYPFYSLMAASDRANYHLRNKLLQRSEFLSTICSLGQTDNTGSCAP